MFDTHSEIFTSLFVAPLFPPPLFLPQWPSNSTRALSCRTQGSSNSTKYVEAHPRVFVYRNTSFCPGLCAASTETRHHNASDCKRRHKWKQGTDRTARAQTIITRCTFVFWFVIVQLANLTILFRYLKHTNLRAVPEPRARSPRRQEGQARLIAKWRI
ncbi:hypothetical protein BDZ97DRAFT_1783674, partial [Flammula alnicola]